MTSIVMIKYSANRKPLDMVLIPYKREEVRVYENQGYISISKEKALRIKKEFGLEVRVNNPK